MRYIKMLSLAAVAAIAAMALIGASSASAVTLCKEAKSPCPAGSDYAAGTDILGSLEGEALLESSLGTVKCTKSSVLGKNTALEGNPLPGLIETLSFESCTLSGSSCTVTVEHLPYKASITANEEVIGNGTMTVVSDGNGTPQAHVNCGSAFNCIVGKTTVSLKVTGGAPAKVTANQAMELFKNEGFICPSTATWKATYKVSPSPMFVVP